MSYLNILRNISDIIYNTVTIENRRNENAVQRTLGGN